MTQALIGSPLGLEGVSLDELLEGEVFDGEGPDGLADTERATLPGDDAAAHLFESGLPEEDFTVEPVASSNDETEAGDDIVQDVAIAAASLGKQFSSAELAGYLQNFGVVEDVRLTIAIEVLLLQSKLTGEKMLDVLARLGFEGEVATARLAKEMIDQAPEVTVESMTPVPSVEVES